MTNFNMDHSFISSYHLGKTLNIKLICIPYEEGSCLIGQHLFLSYPIPDKLHINNSIGMSSDVCNCLIGRHQITSLVTKFKMDQLFLNWYHLWPTSEKKYFNTDALWGPQMPHLLVSISTLTHSRKTSQKHISGRMSS